MTATGPDDSPRRPATMLGDGGPLVVVGAGPAGTLISIYLARMGHPVELYERRADLRRLDVDGGRSINLALATRGIVPLGEAGVLERVAAITVPMAGRIVHPEGVPLDQAELQPYGTTAEDVIHSVSRQDLNAILLDAAEAAGVRIFFDHRCVGVDVDAGVARFTRGGLSAHSGPGPTREVRFGTVFGCDGAGSVVRRDVLAANGGTGTVEPLSHSYKELTIPPADDGGFRLDPNGLHIWPRGDLMLIALANPEGDFTATLFMPTGPDGDRDRDRDRDRDSFASVPDGAAATAFFAREFPEVVDLIPDLATQYDENPVGSLATLRTRGWTVDDRAVLVGDAAHAIVPFHGQGMNAALESCRLLAVQLQRYRHDLARALSAFEHQRAPDTDAIADMALENYLEMRSGVVDPDYRIRRALALELSRRHPDRVAHRYGMVMFTTMPYAEVRARARRQAELYTSAIAGAAGLEDIDLDRVGTAVEALGPLPEWE
ncbi:MAG: FAD-dependent oxidoreductase [Acidimicrobiales bacterium]